MCRYWGRKVGQFPDFFLYHNFWTFLLFHACGEVKVQQNIICLIVNVTGEYQGPALVAVLEGATLSREEVSTLQLCPPWRLRGDTLNYGLGLLSCYSISDLPSVVSDGYFYMFDPRGLTLSLPPSHSPTTKMFSLRGTIHLVMHLASIMILLYSSLIRTVLVGICYIILPLLHDI